MAMPPTPQSPIPRMPSASVATIKSMFSFFRTAEMRRAFLQGHLLTNTDRGVFCTHGCNAGSQCRRSAYIRSAAFRLNDHLTACKITFHSGHGERSSRHFAQLIRLRTELFVGPPRLLFDCQYFRRQKALEPEFLSFLLCKGHPFI